jgi:hypothetical protein
MARTSQQTESAKDDVAAKAAMSESIQQNPQFEMTPEVQDLINNSVANSLANALPAVMAEMMKMVSAQTPNFGNVPSPVTNVSIAPPVDKKPTYLKHYRLDGTVSGKYQMVDVEKLKSGVPIGDAVIKGRWIHFASDHYYANDEQEVAFIEWMRDTQGLPVYEDLSTATTLLRCPVDGCPSPGPFGDETTLKNHLRATHGVESGNA